jgi:hypothetical protein
MKGPRAVAVLDSDGEKVQVPPPQPPFSFLRYLSLKTHTFSLLLTHIHLDTRTCTHTFSLVISILHGHLFVWKTTLVVHYINKKEWVKLTALSYTRLPDQYKFKAKV